MSFSLDIFIVTYSIDIECIFNQLKNMASLNSDYILKLYVWYNSNDNQILQKLKTVCSEYNISTHILTSYKNIGLGLAYNNLLKNSSSPWILILNQKAVPEPDCIEKIMSFALSDDQGCAWELRQIPYENPKIYNPVTLETPLISCTGCLFRRVALTEVYGFDTVLTYAEDIDLSWRLRNKGWKLRYIPKSTIIYKSYAYEIKNKHLLINSIMANLWLRTRFGNWKNIFRGMIVAYQISVNEQFAYRLKLLVKILFLFLKKFKYFRYKTKLKKLNFKPEFIGLNYSLQRDDTFYQFKSQNKISVYPLVSVLIRTCNRPDWLRESLLSVQHQTYPNIEVIIIEDGLPVSEKMINLEFIHNMNLQYYATTTNLGRSKAGNIALNRANGEWMNFLDDDDVFFADHLEVLVQSATKKKVKGVYSLGLEASIEITSQNPFKYRELSYMIRYRQPFCRNTLWDHNYIPIQSVLFHRSLYEEYGGFDEEMEQLEDWNLWTRYTLNNDFILIEKCTSKYHIPFNNQLRELRRKKIAKYYKIALHKQKEIIKLKK